MKKLIVLLIVLISVFCSCTGSKYKSQIFSLVEENCALLDEYVSDFEASDVVPKTLSHLSIQAVEYIESEGIIVFEMYYTGLFDGGVEYGFYYTKSANELRKQFSPNDYMVIEEIAENWYYYEWHNG